MLCFFSPCRNRKESTGAFGAGTRTSLKLPHHNSSRCLSNPPRALHRLEAFVSKLHSGKRKQAALCSLSVLNDCLLVFSVSFFSHTLSSLLIARRCRNVRFTAQYVIKILNEHLIYITGFWKQRPFGPNLRTSLFPHSPPQLV